MLKRLFWLVVAGLAGWLAWLWVQQRKSEFTDTIPQFVPARPSAPASPSPQPPAQVVPPDEAAVGEPEAPAAEDQQPDEAPAPDEAAADAPEAPAAENEQPDEATANAAVDESGDVVAAGAPAEQGDAAAPTAADSASLEGTLGYCVRCRTKREIKDPHEEITESGRRAARGRCPVCGANMVTFLATEEHL